MKRLLVILPAVWMTAGMAWSNAEPAIDANRHALLDLTFRAVAKMPEDPYLKNKARAQYEVVACALELNRPDWAATYAEQVLYWEKGAAFADIALYYAEHENMDAAGASLTRAEDWFSKNEPAFVASEAEQSWRLDRVRTGMVRAGIALDREQDLAKYAADLGTDAASSIVLQKALQKAHNNPAATLSLLTDLARTGDFEAVKNAVAGLVELYGRHYEDQTLCASIREKVEEYCANTPFAFRIDQLTKLGEIDLQHGNAAEALACANEARGIIDARQSPPRFHIPLASEIASLRYRAGEPEKGLQELADCIKLFDEKKREIINIDQADILCSVAEAYQKIGDPQKAQKVYGRAIEVGQINPNSRPRVEDLCRICCSMARNGTEPSGAVWQALEKMNDNLGNPW